MKVRDWEPRRRIEREFVRALQRALAVFLSDPADLLYPSLRAEHQSVYDDAVSKAVLRMVTQLFADNNRAWREAAREGGRGEEIYHALRREFEGEKGQRVDEIIQRRFGHITSYWREGGQKLPDELTQRALRFVEQEAMKGRGRGEIEADLSQLMPDWSNATVKRYARTAVASTHTAVTIARMEELKQHWYVWRTSADQRVRASHRHMDRVLVPLVEPPSPERLIGEKFQGVYHAGQHWNCRCFAAPLMDLDYVQWPHKVFFQGRVRVMSRAEFERRFGRVE